MSELHVRLGELLRLERERRKVDLQDAAKELNVSVQNLKALEEGDVKALPTELYFNLFTKSYAEHLGIDYARTVDAIKEDLAEETGESRGQTANGRPAGQLRPGPSLKESPSVWTRWTQWSSFYRLVAVIAGATVMLFVVLGISQLFSDKSATNTQPSDRAHDSGADVSSDDTQASMSPDFSGHDSSMSTPAESPTLTLKLTAREESWATVLADGDTAVYRNLTPLREYLVEAKDRLIVSIGVPSVVETVLNGKKVDLMDSGTRRISRVEINRANVDAFLARAGLRTAEESGGPRPASRSVTPSEINDGNSVSTGESKDTI